MEAQKPEAATKTYSNVGLVAFSNTNETLPSSLRIDVTNISGVCCVDPKPCTVITFKNEEDIAQKRYNLFIVDADGNEKEVFNAFWKGVYIAEHSVEKGCYLLLRAIDTGKEIAIRKE